MSKNFYYKKIYLVGKEDAPNELDTSFINEDGLKRNLSKFKWEWIWAKHWVKESPASHGGPLTALINTCVEHFRHAPYLWGHVVPIAGFLLILAGLGTMLLHQS